MADTPQTPPDRLFEQQLSVMGRRLCDILNGSIVDLNIARGLIESRIAHKVLGDQTRGVRVPVSSTGNDT